MIRGKNHSEKSGEPTNSVHVWQQFRESNPGHIGERQVLSPLPQPCSPFTIFFWIIIHLIKVKISEPHTVLTVFLGIFCMPFKLFWRRKEEHLVDAFTRDCLLQSWYIQHLCQHYKIWNIKNGCKHSIRCQLPTVRIEINNINSVVISNLE